MLTPYWNEKLKRWQLNIQKNSKRKTFTSSKPHDKEKAGMAECRRKAALWVEGFADKSSWRFDKCWETYLLDVAARTSKDNHIQVEKWGRLYVLPRLKLTKVGRISEQDWQDCITQAKPVKGRPLSKKSYSDIRGTIAGFWKFAKRSNMIEYIPDTLQLPTNAPTVGKGILLPKDLTALFKPSDAWYVNAWRLMAVTGLRPGECYGLRRENISSDKLRVRQAINTRNTITECKNKRAKRDMALPTTAEIILMEQIDKLKAARILSPWIFPEKDGSQPDHRRAYKEWQVFRAENGITVPPYSLRHTFVSMDKDIPEATMKRIVGHSASMDTHGVYDKEIDGELKKAADSVDNMIGKYI